MINKIKKMVADNDINGLADLSEKANEAAFSVPLQQQINESGYFLTEYPKTTDEDGNEEQKQGNTIDDDCFLFNPLELKELNEGRYDPVTLFAAALIIGNRALENPMFFGHPSYLSKSSGQFSG